VIEELMIFDLSLARYQRGLTRFMEICQEVSPGLVFANVIDSFFAVDGAARLGIPAIWTIHESVDPRFWFSELRPELRLKFLHQLPQAKRLLFVAAATERLFSDWREPGTTAVIPNGIDTARIAHEREALDRRAVRAELGVDDQCYMITCVGTTTRRKGQDVLLSAMPAVISGLKGRNAKLFLVGAREIDFLDLLREMIGKLGLHEYVQLVPETPEVGQYYAASDVVVIPSREESAPLVSLEAFAYGVPLVSTPAFGLSEQLEHGENALLVPVEDVESLSAALLRLAEDKELSERLVRSGRERLAAEFSLERMLDRYWLEISALMGG
jgi:glycosyltransferase involved in cell wall biosynthesis